MMRLSESRAKLVCALPSVSIFARDLSSDKVSANRAQRACSLPRCRLTSQCDVITLQRYGGFRAPTIPISWHSAYQTIGNRALQRHAHAEGEGTRGRISACVGTAAHLRIIALVGGDGEEVRGGGVEADAFNSYIF